MTKKIDTGGPAFPGTEVDACKNCCDMVILPKGMSLLDHFAGMYLQAIAGLPDNHSTHEDNACEAYAASVALVAEKRRLEGE